MANDYGHAWHWNNKWNWGAWGQSHPNMLMNKGEMTEDHHEDEKEEEESEETHQ